MEVEMRVYDDVNIIKSIISPISKYMSEYITNKSENDYFLVSKSITHSDVPTYAKRTNVNQQLSENILYYLTTEEMIKIENDRSKTFEVAKQSNINIPLAFFDYLNLPRPREVVKSGGTYKLSDHFEVYLVNDSLDDFNLDSTNKLHERLNHELSNNYLKQLSNIDFLTNNDLTKIDLSYAVHGIGIASDIYFHSLRSTIFRQDNIYLLIESLKDSKRIYILLKRSPLFYKIIFDQSHEWFKFIVKEETRKEFDYDTSQTKEETYKSRSQQSSWRSLLAEEMLNYNTKDNHIFCPFTYLELDYNKAGTLMRASHIKPYNECTNEEAFDINNGLLLSANADALFDKYLISVNESKELEYSFLLKNDHTLLRDLKLDNKIFDLVLNEKRMEYLKDHYLRFTNYESIRKRSF